MSSDSMMLLVLLWFGIGYGVVAIFGLMAQFLSLRARNSSLHEEDRDPHLGRKFGLYLFQHVGILLILVGLSVSAIDIADRAFGNSSPPPPPTYYGGGPGRSYTPPPPPAQPVFNFAQRTAAGLMLSGVLHTVLFTLLTLFGTNARKFPAVGRAYLMNRTLLAGLILLTITTMFCMILFKDTEGSSIGLEQFSKIIGLAFIWGPVALGHFLWVMIGMALERQRARARRDRDD